MRWWVVLLALALLGGGAVPAEEPGRELDGALAPAARWTGPGGNPSGNGRSAAAPLVTEIEPAWKLELDEVLAPPVLWDGIGYVVAKGPKLFAFDVRTGTVRATKKLKSFRAAAGLHVSEGVVFLELEAGKIHAYKLAGKSFKVVWLFRGLRIEGTHRKPGAWVVHDYELYAYFGRYLARVKPGTRWPLWHVPLDSEPQGSPAILGDYVFCCQSGGNTPVTLVAGGAAIEHIVFVSALRRSTGKQAAGYRCEVYSRENNRTPPQLTVTEKYIFIRLPEKVLATKGSRSDIGLQLAISKTGVRISKPLYLWDFDQPPAQHRLGTVAMTGERGNRKWVVIKEKKIYTYAEESKQPGLFRDGVRPTVLGDIVYFGSWAVDLGTEEILWRLPVSRVKFPAVPADRLVLVVEHGVLRAFRGREAE